MLISCMPVCCLYQSVIVVVNSDNATVFCTDHWMVVCKCHKRRGCHMLFIAVCGVGLIWITTMSCSQLTTVNMHLARRRIMSVSIHIIMSGWRHLVSTKSTVVLCCHSQYLAYIACLITFTLHRTGHMLLTQCYIHTYNPTYTVSQKNDTNVAHYNFNSHQLTLVIFGTDIAEEICY